MGGKSSKSKKKASKSYSSDGEQRYFRTAFMHTADTGDFENTRGWWFAHYDGPNLARQMELHPHRLPVLLIAGKDDKLMNNLTLAESGLTSKEGAEILEEEFNFEWHKHKGGEYIRPSSAK